MNGWPTAWAGRKEGKEEEQKEGPKRGYYLIWRHCHYLPVHFGQPQWSETFVNSGLYELERIPLERVG
jgi:hypothetical protein